MRLTFPLWCSRSGRGQGAFFAYLAPPKFKNQRKP